MTVTVQGLSQEVHEAMFDVSLAMGPGTTHPMPPEMVGAALGALINQIVALHERIEALEKK